MFAPFFCGPQMVKNLGCSVTNKISTVLVCGPFRRTFSGGFELSIRSGMRYSEQDFCFHNSV